MQLRQRHAEFPADVQRQVRQDRMALVKEGVERTSQPIVVDLVHRHIPQYVRGAVCRPLGNVAQGCRLTQPRCQQQGQHLAVSKISPWIGRQMLIDDLCYFHPFQQRMDNCQRAEVARVGLMLVSVPGKRHRNKMANLGGSRNISFAK